MDLRLTIKIKLNRLKDESIVGDINKFVEQHITKKIAKDMWEQAEFEDLHIVKAKVK